MLAEYDLQGLHSFFTPATVRERTLRSLWKFWDVLPVDHPSEAVSLGEGLTPLIPCIRRGPFQDYPQLFIKDEALNPTGSFKARGMTAAITRAKALGITTVALPSAGNAGGAAAYYAARAGMTCHVFMPQDTPPANIIETVEAGARVYLVNGLINDCGQLVRRGSERFGWFDLSTMKEPFRVEGKKTMGYELPFDLEDAPAVGQFRLPDVILYPAGGGTGLIGMWKAFQEMEALGWIGPERPRMVAVQAAGCAPIVRAFEQGEEFAPLFPQAHTVASGLRVPVAVGDFLMLRAIRESRGTAVAIGDQELLEGTRELCRYQGISACPEGGAVWRACQLLRKQGWLRPEELIVLFNTGSGVKYNHLTPVGTLPVLNPGNPRELDALFQP